MISGFIEDFLRICQKFHKITHNSIKNRGCSTTITNLERVHAKNTHIKVEANPCSGSREEVEEPKNFTPMTTPTTTTTMDTHRV